jgi:2-dehydro-3-deoxygluconokinase
LRFRFSPCRVVDPVGAGDACAAGCLADRLAGDSPEARLRKAITAGAFAVTARGHCAELRGSRDLVPLGTHREDVIR